MPHTKCWDERNVDTRSFRERVLKTIERGFLGLEEDLLGVDYTLSQDRCIDKT